MLIKGAESDIILILVIGTMGMVILAFGLFFFFIIYQKRLQKQQLQLSKLKAEQQELMLHNTVASQEKERKRFAADLHDEVGAMLSFIKMNLSRLEKKESNPELKKIATESTSNINDVITQVRRITRDLSPPTLSKLGLSPAVKEFIGWLSYSDTVQIHFHLIGLEYRFEPDHEIALFRILQELINNALKHSGASLISIKMKYCLEYICLSVSDNGKGFNPEKQKASGLGLQNLQSRASLLEANYKYRSEPGKGTLFILMAKIKR